MEFGHLSPSPVVLGGLKAAEFQNRVEKKRRENEGDRVLGREGHLPNVIRPQKRACLSPTWSFQRCPVIDSSSCLLAVAQLWLAASCRRRECGGPPSRLCSSLLQLCGPVAPVSLYTRCGQETDELMFQPHPLSNSGNVWAPRPPFPPPPPSLPGICWDMCVYVCWRACRIIEQTLVALIGTSPSICLWLVGRLNPQWHHNAWCLGLPSLVLSLQPHD